MNKRYMDFVPKTANRENVVRIMPKPAEKRVVSGRSSATQAITGRTMAGHEATAGRGAVNGQGVVTRRSEVRKTVKNVEVDEFAVREIFEERKARAGVSTEPRFGVIEDFSDKFVERKVEKRPLSSEAKASGASTAKISGASMAKAKKVTAKMPMFSRKTAKKEPKVTDKVLEAAVKDAEKPETTMRIPKARFVNTEKVTKRPLSKNVYQKKVEVPEEVPKGPVTIIAKPEKDSRMGMVVTIIITIILGAAAGTVAFLLLPK